MIDIRKMPDIVEAINAILNNQGIAEVKTEKKNTAVTVVEIKRQLKKSSQ